MFWSNTGTIGMDQPHYLSETQQICNEGAPKRYVCLWKSPHLQLLVRHTIRPHLVYIVINYNFTIKRGPHMAVKSAFSIEFSTKKRPHWAWQTLHIEVVRGRWIFTWPPRGCWPSGDVKTAENGHRKLVSGFNPSENIGQVGWLFPIYGKIKRCSKPPTRK